MILDGRWVMDCSRINRWFLLIAAFVVGVFSISESARVEVEMDEERLLMRGSAVPGSVAVLESSDDLVGWAPQQFSVETDWLFGEEIPNGSDEASFFRIRSGAPGASPLDDEVK